MKAGNKRAGYVDVERTHKINKATHYTGSSALALCIGMICNDQPIYISSHFIFISSKSSVAWLCPLLSKMLSAAQPVAFIPSAAVVDCLRIG